MQTKLINKQKERVYAIIKFEFQIAGLVVSNNIYYILPPFHSYLPTVKVSQFRQANHYCKQRSIQTMLRLSCVKCFLRAKSKEVEELQSDHQNPDFQLGLPVLAEFIYVMKIHLILIFLRAMRKEVEELQSGPTKIKTINSVGPFWLSEFMQ